MKKRYHRCLSICLLLLFHTKGLSEVPEKKNQLFGKTDNLLTHFEWANADEKILMCLLKEFSVIVARRMLFKRNTFRCQLPQCKKKETNTEQCRQQSSKLTDRELSSISYTIMYMFARGLSFVFFSHLNN